MDTSYLKLKTHGAMIAPITYSAKVLQDYKRIEGKSLKFSRGEIHEIKSKILRNEEAYTRNGVNFSRIQINELLSQRDAGERLEIETIGPYLADYIMSGGVMSSSNLTPEDRIGFDLSQALRQIFPNSCIVALCDDYNFKSAHSQNLGLTAQATEAFSDLQRDNFKKSLLKLFKEWNTLPNEAIEDKDYIFLDESSKQSDAFRLVERLEMENVIKRNGQEITFSSDRVENVLYQTIPLRNKEGRWTCVALDAASFMNSKNQKIAHIVVLPNYMKAQQDKVWEILRLLDILPYKYHNIFFDPDNNPVETVETITSAF